MTITISEKNMGNDRTKMEFFELGIHYYIAGRYAVFSGLVLIAGNLHHHAVELLPKGCLSDGVDFANLKKLRHSLTNLWDTFKKINPDSQLLEFDQTINDLDHLEDLRYPDEIPKGKVVSISPGGIVKPVVPPQRGKEVPSIPFRIQNSINSLKLYLELGLLIQHSSSIGCARKRSSTFSRVICIHLTNSYAQPNQLLKLTERAVDDLVTA